MNEASAHIMDYACNHFGITKQQLISSDRTVQSVDARQVCCFAMRELGFTYKKIGDYLGNRDHSTIMHLIFHRHHNSLENQRIALLAEMSYRDMALIKKRALEGNMEAKFQRTRKFLPWEQ